MNLVKAADAVDEAQAPKASQPSSAARPDGDLIARTLAETAANDDESGAGATAVGTASTDPTGRIIVRPPSR
jgi:hypothetical protein